MPIKIDFLANVRDFLRGTSDVDRALEQTADSLDDVARDGDRATEKLERSFKELADSARDEGRRIDRALGDAGEGGFRRSSAAAGEFRSEALQNFSEVSSSFDGSMTGIQDLAQGTFGGLAAGLAGPLGLAAGGIATGIGLVAAGFQAAEADRQKLQDRAADLADAYIEAGSEVLDALTLADRTAGILTDPEQRRAADELSKALGGDLALAVRILAGDTDALSEAQTRAAAAEEALEGLSTQQEENTGKRKTQLGEEADAHKALIAAVERETEVQNLASETARVQSEILLELINATAGATQQVDEFGNVLVTLPDGKQVVIAADTGLATTNVDTFKGDVATIPSETVTTAKLRDDTEQEMQQILNRLSGRNVYVNVRSRPGGGDF